jgi:hypothetical protein
LLIGREDLVGGNEIENGENGIKTADWVGFFFVSYAGRGAISPHSANFVVVIAAVKKDIE